MRDVLLTRIGTLQDVVDWGLCTGCGACYYACEKGAVTLVNVLDVGIRPRFQEDCASCNRCLSICPGYTMDSDLATGQVPKANEADHELGPVLEMWEGYATDPEIRYMGSSGGLLSALATFCLEKENMAFVVHTAMDEKEPWTNRTVQSRTRGEILARTASRYAPASPCEGLRAIEESDRPCVFIGKPCDVGAVNMARKQEPKLDRNLGLVLTFFCAGTPSTQGTLDLIKMIDVPLDQIRQVRYRGEGWPGSFKVVSANGGGVKHLSYEESWGRLAHYRPLRCQLCPDGLGRVADISCGDAWEKFSGNGNPGQSIVLVRTQRGREILHKALNANYVHLTPIGVDAVLTAQPNLLQRRRELFGRFLAMKLFFIPTPKFKGFSLLHSWMRIPFIRKVQTILGTVRRVVRRGLWRRRPIIARL